MAESAKLGIMLMLFSAASFACGDVGVKVLGGNLSPWQMAGGRALLGLAVVLALVRFKVKIFLIPEWPWHCVLGLSSALGLICTIFTLKTLPLSIAMPIMYLYPALGALLSPLINREKPSPGDLAAIGLAFLAVILLTQGLGENSGAQWTGVAWGLGSAFFIALMANLTRRQAKTRAVPILLFYLFLANLAICLPLALLTDRPVIPAAPDLAGLMLFIAPMLVLGLFLMFQGYKHITAHRGGVIQTLEVVFVSFYGLVFLGEALTGYVIAGGGLMLASAVIITLSRPA